MGPNHMTERAIIHELKTVNVRLQLFMCFFRTCERERSSSPQFLFAIFRHKEFVGLSLTKT